MRNALSPRRTLNLKHRSVGLIPGDGSATTYIDPTSQLRQIAQQASTPSGYILNFRDELGSSQQIGYLTYKNIESGEYYVQQCADLCTSEQYCLGFNIYYERDPPISPDATYPNPQPITTVKCALYGYPVAKLSATNKDQWRANFQIVIAGSNGYSKAATYATVPDFNPPTSLPAPISAPIESYNCMNLTNDGPFDPTLCGTACETKTAFDREHLVDESDHYRPCNFFTAYILTMNGVPQGTYCAFYTRLYGVEYAVNTACTSGLNLYQVVDAVSCQLSQQDPGVIAQELQQV